eukprot:scaffold6066_cov69-Phaeocystis_antarctica.AAC.2
MTRHQRLKLRPRLFAPVLRLQKGVGRLGHDQVDICTGCKESGRNLGCLHRGDGARYTQADGRHPHLRSPRPTERARASGVTCSVFKIGWLVASSAHSKVETLVQSRS